MKVKFSPGASRLQVVKVLKEELRLPLRDAKEMMESGEFECCDIEYPYLKEKLEKVGAGEFYRAD